MPWAVRLELLQASSRRFQAKILATSTTSYIFVLKIEEILSRLLKDTSSLWKLNNQSGLLSVEHWDNFFGCFNCLSVKSHNRKRSNTSGSHLVGYHSNVLIRHRSPISGAVSSAVGGVANVGTQAVSAATGNPTWLISKCTKSIT